MIDIKTFNSVLRRLNEMARSYTPIGSKERAEALFLESEINFFINKIKVSETRLDELEKLVKPYKPIRAKNGNDICASCGNVVHKVLTKNYAKYCPECGRQQDWSKMQ